MHPRLRACATADTCPVPGPAPADVHYSSVLQFDRRDGQQLWSDLL